MVDRLFETVMTIALAIVGVALVATIVARNAQTSGVINASGSAFASDLNAAEAPVAGS